MPSSMIFPLTGADDLRCRPRMAELDTDLPEPDSPTMPRVLPRSRVNVRPSTALTTPSAVGKWTLRSLTESIRFPSVIRAGQAESDARVDDGVQAGRR